MHVKNTHRAYSSWAVLLLPPPQEIKLDHTCKKCTQRRNLLQNLVLEFPLNTSLGPSPPQMPHNMS